MTQSKRPITLFCPGRQIHQFPSQNLTSFCLPRINYQLFPLTLPNVLFLRIGNHQDYFFNYFSNLRNLLKFINIASKTLIYLDFFTTDKTLTPIASKN